MEKKGKTAKPSRRLVKQRARRPYPSDGQTLLRRHQYQHLLIYLQNCKTAPSLVSHPTLTFLTISLWNKKDEENNSDSV